MRITLRIQRNFRGHVCIALCRSAWDLHGKPTRGVGRPKPIPHNLISAQIAHVEVAIQICRDRDRLPGSIYRLARPLPSLPKYSGGKYKKERESQESQAPAGESPKRF